LYNNLTISYYFRNTPGLKLKGMTSHRFYLWTT